MSAGLFINTFVPSFLSVGRIYAIRVQPETLLAVVNAPNLPPITNVSDPGPATEAVSANVGGSTRRRGFHVGMMYLSLLGTAPTGYSETSRTSIPIMNLDFFTAASRKGAIVTYLGTTWRVTGTRAEKTR